MRKYDVVYILKNGAKPNELRYSLRSIEANMDHGKVWFYCGQPEGLIPDRAVPEKQEGSTKWERVRYSLRQICQNDKISKKFWLFNDDFYVLAKMDSTKPLHRGLLQDHILDVEARHGRAPTGYTKQLRKCMDQLKQAGCTTLDYALHVPMLIDREKMLETLEMFPRCPMFRSLYGNYAQVGGDFFKDVKTIDPDKQIPEGALFFSTSNRAFNGAVLRQMQERFPDPCRYEAEYVEKVDDDGETMGS